MATVLCCAHIIQLHLILRGGGGGGGREREVDTFGWIRRSENPSRVSTPHVASVIPYVIPYWAGEISFQHRMCA